MDEKIRPHQPAFEATGKDSRVAPSQSHHRRQTQRVRLELGAVSQRLIPTGERSGLQTRIAMTESVSLCVRMKVTAFLGLDSAIRASADVT